jgi:hypothetical protein
MIKSQRKVTLNTHARSGLLVFTFSRGLVNSSMEGGGCGRVGVPRVTILMLREREKAWLGLVQAALAKGGISSDFLPAL